MKIRCTNPECQGGKYTLMVLGQPVIRNCRDCGGTGEHEANPYELEQEALRLKAEVGRLQAELESACRRASDVRDERDVARDEATRLLAIIDEMAAFDNGSRGWLADKRREAHGAQSLP